MSEIIFFCAHTHTHFPKKAVVILSASPWFQDAGTAWEDCQNHVRLRAPSSGLTSRNEGWPGGENERGINRGLSFHSLTLCVCVSVCKEGERERDYIMRGRSSVCIPGLGLF